ncbi:LysR family transcriptional regulator [Streptosporangium lutulentum]
MIDTRRLRTLRAVADHRTVTAAAAALHLTPSAVSQQLVALEHEVGHRLLERGGRGVRLTAVGRILLGHTNEVLAQLERAGADIAAYTTGTAGEVKVASFATAIGLVVAPAMGTLRIKEPGIQVKVLDAEGDQSLTMVLDGAVDVAVAVEYRGAPAEDDRRLSRIPLYSEPFDMVLPRDHPWRPSRITTETRHPPRKAARRRRRPPGATRDRRPSTRHPPRNTTRRRCRSPIWPVRSGSAPIRATPATT